MSHSIKSEPYAMHSTVQTSGTLLTLTTEADTIALAQQFAKACETQGAFDEGVLVYLQGDLGAGKSFFSRAFVQTFLPEQKVKSPTYTLVETYAVPAGNIQHFDLYRLCDPEELEFLAIRDLLMPPYIGLVEWPIKGKGVLPDADIMLEFKVHADYRQVLLNPLNKKGKKIVKSLAK